VHKRYGGLVALAGVDLCVDLSEVVALVGPSGSGKSTLLRCLNGLEAIDGGTIEIAGSAVPAQRRVELTIRDNGPGMTPGQLKRVFTPFYTTKAKGLGVGLALAKRIVERFGGCIRIDSAPGRGTAVCLSMPIA